MKTGLFLASAATAVALSLVHPAWSADSAQDFVNEASVGGMFEVESSKAVIGKVHSEDVKEFAQKMIDDHGAANAKLAAIAGDQKLQVPKTLDANHKGELEALSGSTDGVDEFYVKLQRDAHDDAVKLFENYAQDGDNADLKTFAAQTLPTLKMHQEMAEEMASRMEDNSPGATTSATPAINAPDSVNPEAPVAGANSFTEDQARSCIEDAGYSDVSALAKDDQGIWRGQAVKDGKKIAVALDFQGSVVTGTN